MLFTPNAFQEKALRASADEVLLGGAKGPGKTHVLLAVPLRWCHREQMAVAFVRESFRELQRPMDEARKFYSRLPTSHRPYWTGHNKRWTWPSGAFLQFGYADKVENLTWAQGGNWSHVLYDEVGNQRDERVIDTLLSEVRCKDPTIRRQFIGSANPGFAGHGVVKRRYVIPCGKNGERVAWTRVTLADGRKVLLSRQFVPGRVTDNPILLNDPVYMARLMSLPERMRKCLLEGDWDAASGTAFDELNPAVHLVTPFNPPAHWPYIAAFDWGYSHWAVFMWGRVSDDGRIYVCGTVKKRLMKDWDLASVILNEAPAEALQAVHAGHDLWARKKAEQDDGTPTRAEYFTAQGIHVTQANIARVSGYANLMHYLGWMESDFLPQRQPMLQFFDTPTNRWLVEEHLPSMVNDPDDPADVLKVDASSEDGAGGDDGYDCTRYLCASRPMAAPSARHLLQRSAWDDDVLRREAEKFNLVDTSHLTKKKTTYFEGM